MTATVEEFANTVAAYEAAAIKTGEWDGIDAPEFSADGVAWSMVWIGEGEPLFARVTVHRKGVRVPYTAVIAWAEALPAVDEWRALWERKPMTLFGASAKRAAIRHAFRDVIGDRRDADEADPSAPTAPAADAAPRDWETEYWTAATVEQLEQIRRDVRAARQNTDALNALFTERKEQLTAAAWEPARPGRAPQDHLPGNRAARRAAKKGRR